MPQDDGLRRLRLFTKAALESRLLEKKKEKRLLPKKKKKFEVAIVCLDEGVPSLYHPFGTQ